MTEKIKVPSEVAKGIEAFRARGFSNMKIIDLASGALCSQPDLLIRRWALNSNSPATSDDLLQALVNGYEFEDTPEELLLKEFKSMNGACTPKTEFGKSAIERRKGFLTALDILGVKVEGVNA